MSLEAASELLLFQRYRGTVQRTLSLTNDAVQLGNYVSVADVTLGDNGIVFHVHYVHQPAANVKLARRGTPQQLVSFLVQDSFARQLRNAISHFAAGQDMQEAEKTDMMHRCAGRCDELEQQLRKMSSRGES